MSKNKRDININWHLFSLAIKNKEIGTDKNKGNFNHIPAHRVERVMLAASKDGIDLLKMYTAFGIRHFISGDEYDDGVIKTVLNQLELDAKYADFADDGSLDDELNRSTQQAVDTVGQDIGVPTIVFNLENGERRGFFGPVMQALPDVDESVELWDGLSKLANNSNFYELKRGRSNGGPDVFSTAKC